MEQERELPQQPEVSANATGVGTRSEGDTTGFAGACEQPQSNIEGAANSKLTEAIGDKKSVVKKPIFIATVNPIIAKSVEHYLFHAKEGEEPILSKDEYVFLVTHHSVYHGLHQQWCYSEMEKEEQDRINRTKAMNEIRDKAFRTAIELEYRIQSYRSNPKMSQVVDYFKRHPEELMEFNYGELKTILNGTRTGKGARATRQDTWVLMDLLLLQGYIVQTEFVNLQNTPKEKIRYRLVVSAADRKKALEEQMAKNRISIEGLNQDIAQLQMQLDEINQQIAAHANNQTPVTESSLVEETTDVD